MTTYDFGPVALLIDETGGRAAVFVETGPDDLGDAWDIALAELYLHQPSAVLDPEPEYEPEGVEVFLATF